MATRLSTAPVLSVALFLVTTAACNSGNRSVTTPLQPSAVPTPANVTVSGVVREFTDAGRGGPVPNLRVRVRGAGSGDGAVGGVALPDVVTDAEGRYTITSVSPNILFLQTASGSDYRSVCDEYPIQVDAVSPSRPDPFVTDLPVVRSSWSGNRLPPGMWIVGTSVWGTVTESSGGSTSPVANAIVDLDGGITDPKATTNANGFFMVCSVVGSDQYRSIAASKSGYQPATRTIFGGWEYEVHLALTRQ